MIMQDNPTPRTRCGQPGTSWRHVLVFCCLIVFSATSQAGDDRPRVTQIADLENPWALAFLPDGRMLVTEKRGKLLLLTTEGNATGISGVPQVAHGGQGGLGDVALHPDFEANSLVYLSYAETGSAGYGAVVARATLRFHDSGGALDGLEVIWRQEPKVSGRGHYGHRIVFGPAGFLWISSGDRQKFSPAQDMQGNLGKVLRLEDDGRVPEDNPFAGEGGVSGQIWSLGHRNPLGMAFDPEGRLWVVEMGPSGGDELNLITRGANYGYPIVSEGNHYGGREIPDHSTRPEFQAPSLVWTPVISPGNLIFYTGDMFPQWRDMALIAGLSAKAVVRVAFDDERAVEAGRLPMGSRIRDVAQGPNGALWLLEDGAKGSQGRLLRLTP